MLCTTATNTSNTIRTQTGAAVSLIQRSADASAHGRKSAAIGGGISSRRAITRYVIAVFLENSEIDSKLKQWINSGI